MESVIRVIYHNFYTEDGKENSVGGIQTYLRNLLPHFVKLGFNVILYQKASVQFKKTYEGVIIHGCVLEQKTYRKQVAELLDIASSHANKEKDILFFATSTDVLKNDFKRSITIQHGITWDVPKHENFSHSRNLKQIFLKAILAFRTIRDLDYVSKTVCVDYNFVNWYRTQVAYSDKKFNVIPNFVNIPKKAEKSSNDINIIFARRFQVYRGTRVFANAAEKILNNYDNVNIIFAGDGPEKQFLTKKFQGQSRVSFIQYESSESLKIHENIHISVVPTVGSEGTSLSLLEAMASGCASVCSDVGGMTNIILNNYNGKMVSAGDSEELYEAIKELIDNPDKRQQIAEKGYETVKESFSFERWLQQWQKVIMNI